MEYDAVGLQAVHVVGNHCAAATAWCSFCESVLWLPVFESQCPMWYVAVPSFIIIIIIIIDSVADLIIIIINNYTVANCYLLCQYTDGN
jgi:hypothetical protein